MPIAGLLDADSEHRQLFQIRSFDASRAVARGTRVRRPSDHLCYRLGKPLFRAGPVWHDNGQKEEEGSYHDGQLDGSVTAWDRDGHVWLKTEYKGGALANDPTAAPPSPPGQADAPALPADVK